MVQQPQEVQLNLIYLDFRFHFFFVTTGLISPMEISIDSFTLVGEDSTEKKFDACIKILKVQKIEKLQLF